MLIIDLPIDTQITKITEVLSQYELIQALPLDIRTADGIVKVIRYFAKEKIKTAKKELK